MRLHVTGYFQGEYMFMVGKDGLIMNYKEYSVNIQKTVTISKAMLTRPFVKKRRTNYFGFGKKGLQKKETLQKTKRHFFFFIIGIKPLSTQQKN